MKFLHLKGEFHGNAARLVQLAQRAQPVMTAVVLSALCLLTSDLVVAAHVPNRILIKFKSGTTSSQIQMLLGKHQAVKEKTVGDTDILILKLPTNKDERAVLSALQADAYVEFAELDELRMPQAVTPNDPYFAGQWNLTKVSAPDAWSVTTGSPTITIAILDTGVDGTSADLASKMVPGWNVYDNNSTTQDVYGGTGHGTLVAGIAGAASNNATGISGMCWGCRLMPVRVSAPSGAATDSNIAAGILWGAQHGARVINLGFQVTGSATVAQAILNAQGQNGCVVNGGPAVCNAVTVAPAGDFGSTYPNADNPNLLEVGSTDQNDAVYSWSNKGAFVDLVAPGGGIYTTIVLGFYGQGTGTSYSAPHVSGVAGLLLSLAPSLTPSQIIAAIKQSADSLGGSAGSGSGRLNALKALQAVGGGTTSSPCDVNSDGSTNVLDVQQEVNQALGIAACTKDLNRDGACNVLDVQRVTNAALGGPCVAS